MAKVIPKKNHPWRTRLFNKSNKEENDYLGYLIESIEKRKRKVRNYNRRMIP